MTRLALVHTAQKDGHHFIIFFLISLKKEIIKMKGAGVAPTADMITTTLPASRLL